MKRTSYYSGSEPDVVLLSWRQTIFPYHLRQWWNTELVEDGDREIVERRFLERDSLIGEQDARNEPIVDGVVAAPGFVIIHENLSWKFTEWVFPGAAIAPVVANHEIRADSQVISPELGLGSEDQRHGLPPGPVVSHGQQIGFQLVEQSFVLFARPDAAVSLATSEVDVQPVESGRVGPSWPTSRR